MKHTIELLETKILQAQVRADELQAKGKEKQAKMLQERIKEYKEAIEILKAHK
jgi:hypothetical protein